MEDEKFKDRSELKETQIDNKLLSSFFKTFQPKGSFAYISTGSHISIFKNQFAADRTAFAIDPYLDRSTSDIHYIQL